MIGYKYELVMKLKQIPNVKNVLKFVKVGVNRWGWCFGGRNYGVDDGGGSHG